MGKYDKNYGSPGSNVNVTHGSNWGAGDIAGLLESIRGQNLANERIKLDKAANTRADARLVMEEANQKFLDKTRADTKHAANTLATWSNYNIDTNLTGAQNPEGSFIKTYDYQTDFHTAFQGYAGDMASRKITPNKRLFKAEFDANYLDNMNSVAKRFTTVMETERIAKNFPKDGNLLHKYMQKYRNADSFYNSYASLYGAPAATAAMGGYSPPDPERTYVQAAKDLIAKQSYTDPETGETIGGGLKGLGAGLMLAAPGLSLPYLGWKSYKQFGPAKTAILEEAKTLSENYKSEKKIYEKVKDKKTGKMVNKLNKRGKPIVKKVIPASGMTPDEFFAKYNMKKSQAFVKGKPTDKFIKLANALSRKGTTIGKGLEFGKRYGGIAAGAGIGSQVGEEVGRAITGGPGGEMLGSLAGGATGAYGGLKGQRGLVAAFNKLREPKTMNRLRKWAAGKGAKNVVKKRLLAALGKLGLSAAGVVVPEPVSSAVGVLGVGWAAHDIYQLAKEVPELMDIIFTGE